VDVKCGWVFVAKGESMSDATRKERADVMLGVLIIHVEKG